jgi:predicted AlkP superfamily phosphohydrolase/phosphomutase
MGKVLLVGWDAADLDVARLLAAKGILPNLAKLMDTGASGHLHVPRPLLSASGWGSVISGKRATKHGMTEGVEPRPDRLGVRPARRHGRLCAAVWDILSHQSIPCHVVNFPTTFPAEDLGGVNVSNLWAGAAEEDPARALVYPPEAEPSLRPLRIASRGVSEKSLNWFMPRLKDRDPRDRRHLTVATAIAEDHNVHEAMQWSMKNVPWEFAAVCYAGLHRLSHAFMQCAAPRLGWISEYDVAMYGDVVEAAYQHLDIMLGQLIALAGPDATVIVASDHGFRSGADRPGEAPRGDLGDAWYRDRALGVIAGPGIKRCALPDDASLLDITPTILSLFELPIGEDMDGRVWSAVIPHAKPAAAIPSWDEERRAACPWPDESHEQPDAETDANVAYLRELGYHEAHDAFAEFAIRRTLADERYNRGVAFLEEAAHGEALAMLEPLVSDWPQFPEYRLSLARAYRGLGDNDAADWQEYLARPRSGDAL